MDQVLSVNNLNSIDEENKKEEASFDKKCSTVTEETGVSLERESEVEAEDFWKIKCDGCSEIATFPKDKWCGNCQNEQCPLFGSSILAPIAEGLKYVFVPKNTDPERGYCMRYEIDSEYMRHAGQVFIISATETRIRNDQKVYRATLAEGLLKTSLEQLIAANEKIRELEEGRGDDAAHKEKLTKQVQVVTEEKDLCVQRVADLSSQLEDSTDMCTFWKQLANTYATKLAEKTKELLESRKELSSYRLESEQKLRMLQESFKKNQADSEQKILETTKQFDAKKATFEKEFEEFSRKLIKSQGELGKKAKAMERLKKETTATIQKLERNDKWMRSVISDLAKQSSLNGTADKRVKVTASLDKESNISMGENHFNCGNLIDLYDEEKASSSESSGKSEFNHIFDRCQFETDDGMEGEDNTENGMDDMMDVNIQMNDKANGMEDDEAGEASSSSA